MDKLVVTLMGVAAIAFVYWFFLMKREQAVTVEDAVEIVVEEATVPK